MIPLSAFLTLGALLFAMSLVGILLNQRNLLTVLMCVELMLLAVNTNFVAFAHFLKDINGEIFVFFILAVAAAETAIGLAILILVFRRKHTLDLAKLNILKG
jgi:NADH-quinone oxidoreductase subunit K